MLDAGRRPMGRLCYWLLIVGSLGLAAFGAGAGPDSTPATTTVADTVYMADGTPAQGSLIISWPAFVTAGGAVVGAGTTSVTLGAHGALNVTLVPNAGATPSGMYYSVVYQLGPGQVRTEQWIVPSTSPANLAAVRTTPGSGVAAPAVSMQYVNSELAKKADDSAVVHVNGTETISGAKTFASAPNVPAPTSAGQVATKGYVDAAVSNVGAGNYLPTAGGTMSGPITLPSDPVASLQAATKQYVDSGLATKADLAGGTVPPSELGTGQATAGNCLQGNGTWAPCAAGGSGNLSSTPSASQNIAQPVGTQFATNNLANIRYVTASWNWLQTPTDNLATAGSVTLHLSPCPLGMDTNSSANYYTYKVYISGKGTAEAVPVTGGSCTPGASSGTIAVTTAYSHAAGYTVGSASGGIQEAWNDAWTSDIPRDAASATAPYVKLVADTNYSVYATVYLRGRGGILDGAGALIACSTRDRCIYIGTMQSGPYVHHHKLYNLTGSSMLNVDGVQVASVSEASGTYSITTASNHPFVVGDVVDCEYYSQTTSQHWVSTVKSVTGATGFTVAFGNGNFAAGANTFGFCNILNTFIENNSDHVAVQDINVMQLSPSGPGYFTYGIVNDNDQQFIVERASNRSTQVLKSSANWPLGAFLYQRTDQGSAGITYVHNSEFTNLNCATGGGNGFVMTDTVCQGFPAYGVRYFGGYQPATFQNIYQESTGGTVNPMFGLAAQMGYLVQGGPGTKFVGTFPTNGYWPVFASGGPGANERDYFVVPRSSTMGAGPLMFAGYAQPSSSNTNVTVMWPSIELQDGYYHQSLGTLTWDVLVVTGQSGSTPNGTGMYALATNAAVACGTNGICSFTDTQNAPTTYTVPSQQFFPVFWYWATGMALNNTTVFTDVAGFDPAVVVSQGTSGVAVVAEQCVPGGAAQRRTPAWVSCLASSINNGSGYAATVLQQQDIANNGPFANSKGRLNFGKAIGTPNDLITLADSNLTKTLSAWGQRPSNDAADMAIGTDQTGGMSQRAGTSISSYINVVPSGTNFLERLTAGGKTFNVPVTVNGALNVSGNVTLPVTGSGYQCLHVNSSGIVSGTGADCGSGGSGSGSVNAGSTSQVAMYTGNGSVVSGDSVLTDNGTTLTYMGAGGIGTSAGSFSGNVTVNGQLQVAGPWMVSTPIPGTTMASAGAGTSALGISNDGNFYISANGTSPQKIATTGTSSFFSNLTQEDANDVGQSNGANGQTLHVYGTYSNASTFERAGLGWDGSDSYFVVKSENSGSGTYQRGLGFWIGSGIRWGINTASEFKPFSNNSFDIGEPAYAPRTVYAGTSLDTLTGGRLNFELCNDTGTGTALNLLAKYNAANPACAVKAGITDADGILGVVSSNPGVSGNAVITYRGYVQCSFDGGTTAGDYVVPSTSTAGDCHDAGSTRPTGVQVLGRVESTNSVANTYGVRISLDSPVGAGSMPSATEGNILVNSSTGSGTNYTPLLYEIHSSGFAAGTTLKTMLGNCPGSGTCRVILDPGVTIPVGASGDYPVIIGPGYNDGTWQHVTVENRGANLQCTLTGGGSTTDCIQIGEWGALIGNNDGNGTAGGAVITSVSNATYRSIVSNAGVCGNSGCGTGAGATGYQNYLQQRFSFEGNAIYPSGTTTLSQGLLSLIAVEGNAKVSHIGLGGLSYTSNLYIADGPYSGDNNSLLFEDVIGVCNNRPGCVGLNILGSPSTGNGNGINMTFHEVGFGNTAMGSGCNSGAGCAINIDGSTGGTHNSSYVADILFDGVYIEQSGTYPTWLALTAYASGNSIKPTSNYFTATTAGTSGASAPNWATCTSTCSDGTVTWTNVGATNPSHFIEITNARDVDMRGINFNAGTVNNCITINHAATSYTGRIHLTGRVGSGHCTNVVNNGITGYTLSGTVPSDLDYTYPGEQAQAGQVVDGGRVAIGTETVGKMCFPGSASGQACLDAAAAAGSPSTWLMPTADPTSGQVLQAGTPGSGNVQLAWATPTVSASNITTGNLPAAQLPVQNWWISVATGGGTTPALSSTTNKMKVFGVVLTYPVTTTQVSYYVQTADNTANTYDLGIYDSTGTLRAHTGSIAGTTLAPSAGWKTLNWTGSATLLPGRYLLAITSSCTSSCATFLGSNANGITFQGSNVDLSVASGGLCPGSVAWPADSLNGSTSIPVWQVH